MGLMLMLNPDTTVDTAMDMVMAMVDTVTTDMADMAMARGPLMLMLKLMLNLDTMVDTAMDMVMAMVDTATTDMADMAMVVDMVVMVITEDTEVMAMATMDRNMNKHSCTNWINWTLLNKCYENNNKIFKQI